MTLYEKLTEDYRKQFDEYCILYPTTYGTLAMDDLKNNEYIHNLKYSTFGDLNSMDLPAVTTAYDMFDL